jgi:hypothetical protein
LRPACVDSLQHLQERHLLVRVSKACITSGKALSVLTWLG